MKHGFRVYDADTHVYPAAEVLERYVDPSFRERLPELAEYRIATAPPGGTPGWHQYRIGTKAYRRVLGEAAEHPTFTGKDTKWMGTKKPRVGVQDDQAASRLQDMDEEGADAHFMIPTSWTSVTGLDDPSLELGLLRAYHRHMADYCAQAPDRLKTMVVVSARAVEESVREIQAWGKSKWAVAVMPLLGENTPVDHPALEPIWKAAEEHDLAIIHHSITWNPPFFPGYRDVWDNIFLGRLASHPWGGMRFLASFLGAGIMDRYPTLRMGILECGFGWLPFWARRMDEQAVYVGATAPLKRPPSEYLTSGRFFCSIEAHEGEEMFRYVTRVLGDGVLMYSSDYPHAECQFPDSVENVMAWTSVEPDGKRKLFWDNANHFYKQT